MYYLRLNYKRQLIFCHGFVREANLKFFVHFGLSLPEICKHLSGNESGQRSCLKETFMYNLMKGAKKQRSAKNRCFCYLIYFQLRGYIGLENERLISGENLDFFDFNQVISESNILKLISYRDWEVHHIQVQFIKVVRKRSG